MSTRLRALIAGLLALVVIALGAAWWLGLFEEAPEEANVDDIAAAVAAEDAEDADSDATGTADGIDGTWAVRPLEEATFVGYRIDEVLTTIGDFTVVGRTSDVSGSLTAEGTTITAVEIVADMTTLTTDNPARDNQMRSQALETGDFPEATFVLAEPIDLGPVPAEGESVSVEAVGDLTIHGVTQRVAFPLDAQLVSGSIVAAGQLDVALADFDISAPSAPVVASVEDTAILELSLVFSRG